MLAHMDLPPELPILLQHRSGAGSVGEHFIQNVNASLFALRSFSGPASTRPERRYRAWRW